MKLLDLERHMRGHGCLFVREGGAHTIWKNPVVGKVAPVPRPPEIKEGTVRNVCRHLIFRGHNTASKASEVAL